MFNNKGINATKNEKKSTGELAIELIGTAFFSPLFALFLGWVFHSFM
jgi:hypothetical protein